MRMSSPELGLALGHHRARPGLRGLFALLPYLARLRRERRALLVLDDHLLRDVGISRAQALTEATRPLWDAPHTWRR
jgi:uncharacterized protein YjiS (DUF1127 family)